MDSKKPFSTSFWDEIETEKAKNAKKAEELICPFCHADLRKVGYTMCNCRQGDKQCLACNRSWHKCKFDGSIQTGHPCVQCKCGSLNTGN